MTAHDLTLWGEKDISVMSWRFLIEDKLDLEFIVKKCIFHFPSNAHLCNSLFQTIPSTS